MPAKKLLSILFTTLGLGMTITAYIWYSSTIEFLNSTHVAQGTVVELQRIRSSTTTTYKPIVSFRTQAGVQVRFTSSFASNPPIFDRGETVSVLYLKNDPEQAKVKSFISLWAGTSALFGIGALFLMIAVAINLFSKPSPQIEES